MQQDQVRTITEMFSEAALRPEMWPEALARLAATVGAAGALGQMVGAGGYVAMPSTGFEDTIREFVESGWHVRNPRMARGLALTKAGARGFITEYMMLSSEELARDPFHQEFAPKHELDIEAGIVLASDHGSRFVLTIDRAARRGSFLGAELDPMNRLAEILTPVTSFALRMKLAAATSILDTMNARGEALALLAPSGCILHMTARFEALLRGRLIQRNGRAHALDPAEDNKLQALIARSGVWLAAPDQPLPPVVLQRHSGAPLVARCLPVAGAARDFLGLARVVLALDELRTVASGVEAPLRSAFDLTPAEARLARRLGEGVSLREAADAEGITFETARSRLKSISAKTGTSRQAELALLVAKLAR